MPHFEPGTHPATVKSVQFGTSKKGTATIAISFEGEGGHGVWYGYFTEKGTNGIRKTVTALGIPWDEENDATFGVEGLTTALVGLEAVLVVEMEDDLDGNPRPRIRWVNAPGGGALANPMDAAEVAKFAAQFRLDAGGGGGDGLEDIPFSPDYQVF